MNLGDPVAPASVPRDWQLGLPDAASPAMAQIVDLNRLLVYLGGAAFVLLLAALAWIVLRYNVRAHPAPDRHKDDALVFTGFFGAMVVVLVLAAVPALRLAVFAADAPKPDLTVEVVGKMGYWTYAYPGEGDFRFDSRRLDPGRAKAYRQPDQMAADRPLVVPANRTVVILATSADIVHLWSVPALGIGVDAIPGRVNRVWFRASEPGIYYGLCAAACGGAGRTEPVAVKVVSEAEYRGWLAWARNEYGDSGP